MRNNFLILFGQFLFLVVIDQITKLLFSHRDFFIGLMHIHPMKNFGLSFSLNFGVTPNLLLIVLGLLVFSYYFWTYRRQLNNLQQLFFLLVFAGAISNIADRIVLGYVRDFLDFGLGFTFNLADLFVAVGLIMILFSQPKSEMNSNF